MDIVTKHRLSDLQYVNELSSKRQVYLHHTAGNKNGPGVIAYWESNKERVGTSYVIDYAGVVYECFPDEKWSYHLGLKKAVFDKYDLPYLNLDKQSIGIELCSWGPLTLKGGEYFNYVKGKVPASEVTNLSKLFKGYQYYHTYSEQQIEALYLLLKKIENEHKIELKYSDKIWDIDTNALKGVPGLYTHVSVRKDKSDCFPQASLIKMLETV